MFYQIFLSPQVKRSVIITDEYSTYELPHKLLNDLRLGNMLSPEYLVPSPPAKMEILLILAKIL